ncbi:MAG: DUF951 domain-containing protein [Clostridiales bacterium]|nr:DUF951 domain-containing protein [Clostridiales bacterium]
MVVALAVGDTVQMRKKHPCGSELFTVLRVGSDVRIRCLGCQRDLTLERVKLEKTIRKVIPGGKGDV